MLSGKLKRTACKGMAGLLTAAMCTALIPCVTGGSKVSADVTKNQNDTYLGVSGITNPDKPETPDSAWSGCYVYFGSYEMFPIKFRVLAKDSTAQTAHKSLFLDSDVTLFNSCFNDTLDSGKWDGSYLQGYLNGEFFNTSFSLTEQNAIATSVYAGGESYAEGTYEEYCFQSTTGVNDKVFLLDYADIMNESYGYYPDSGWIKNTDSFEENSFYYTDFVTNHSKYYNFYWLRSEYKLVEGFVGEVYNGGVLKQTSVFKKDVGVAPALCVDQDSILFSSRIPYDYDEVENEFTLTLIDEEMSIGIPEGEFVTLDEEGLVTVPYVISGGDADSANRVSLLILDGEYSAGNANNAHIIYYDEIGGEFGRNGTGVFELPEQLDAEDWGEAYHVYIVAEDVNGWAYTDYASEPLEIEVPADGWVEIDGEYYFYEVITQTYKKGWLKDKENWYYLDKISGVMLKGWQYIDGFWFYFDNSGKMLTGWNLIGGFWYYLGDDGRMRTGWQEIGGFWYFLGDNGKMRTGWLKDGGSWYYLSDSGAMVTGWQYIGGYWYYFDDTGRMVTGWIRSGDIWYYLSESGAMATGWKEIDGVYYYFRKSGAMASDEYIDGYRLEKSGAWSYKAKACWTEDSKGWWYGDDSGWYAKNQTLKIDGKLYEFDASGYWIES